MWKYSERTFLELKGVLLIPRHFMRENTSVCIIQRVGYNRWESVFRMSVSVKAAYRIEETCYTLNMYFKQHN